MLFTLPGLCPLYAHCPPEQRLALSLPCHSLFFHPQGSPMPAFGVLFFFDFRLLCGLPFPVFCPSLRFFSASRICDCSYPLFASPTPLFYSSFTGRSSALPAPINRSSLRPPFRFAAPIQSGPALLYPISLPPSLCPPLSPNCNHFLDAFSALAPYCLPTLFFRCLHPLFGPLTPWLPPPPCSLSLSWPWSVPGFT